MTILKFQGKVEIRDRNPVLVLIDDRDVVAELDWGRRFNGPVTVAFADQHFTGDLDAEQGLSGYSEWTPGEPTVFTIGGHDILDLLERYEDQEITLWVADEPINTLE